MDAERFDQLWRSWVEAVSRRRVVRSLASAVLGGLLPGRYIPNAAAKKGGRGKKRKKKCAKAGQTTNKKRKKCCAGLSKNGNGVCASASSPPGDCALAGCPANQICLRSGVCQPCTVTCTGTPAQCGAALQAAMNGGGTVYVCPGRYQGGFTLSNAVSVIGAGEGSETASNTVLDANDLGSVLQIDAAMSLIELERLRLTDGHVLGAGGGISVGRATLRMTECTVSGNTAEGIGGFGGGIAIGIGTLEMTRCTVRDNHAVGTIGQGGGIYTTTTTTLTDCVIEDNRATVEGGGLFVGCCGGTITLTGSTRVRDNAAQFGGGILSGGPLVIAETCRVTGNTAAALGNGGGINHSQSELTLQGPPGAISPIVVDNCRDNCSGRPVPTCATTPVSCPP